MTKISVWVQSDQGRHQPGTAIIYLDGEVVARLRGEEGYEVEIQPPQVSTRLRQPDPDPHGPFPLPDGPPEVEAARAEVAKHMPKTLYPMSSQWACDVCAECGETWPCATVRQEQPQRPDATFNNPHRKAARG